MIIILTTSYFRKALKKIPEDVAKQFKIKQAIFKKNPFTSSLKTHKLSGKLSHYHSFSINYQYRVLFEFLNEKTVLFINVGTHGIYK